jgi:Gp157 protein
MPLPASCYANVTVMPAPAAQPERTRAARKAAADPERERELRLKRKIDQANAVLDRLEAREAAYAADSERMTAELERIAKRQAFAQARREKLEERILRAMSAADISHAAGIQHEFSARPAGVKKLIVDSLSKIPANWMRTPKPAKAQPDKLAMKAALEADPDLVIAGVRLVQTVTLVRK